jgi:hypothetical protein
MSSEDEYTGGRRTMDECTELSELCPVEATVLGYIPNLGASVFFAIVFGILLSYCVGVTVWKRTWTYSAGLTIGLLLETAGMLFLSVLHSSSCFCLSP